MNIPDDPIIRCLEETGLAPWQTDEHPTCPVCGAECETIYRDKDGDIVGCDECVTEHDAWELIDD